MPLPILLAAVLLQPSPVREVAQLRFYSSYWVNLHHTLHTASRPAGPGKPGTADAELTASMTAAERMAWTRALDYYAREMAPKDLRVGDGMAAITEALSQAGDTLPSTLAPEHAAALSAADPVYRRLLWPAHDRANRAWIADVAGRLDQIAPSIVPRLARLYGRPWFAQPHRVDITARGRAYTYGRPVWHSVLASDDPQYAGWAGAEMVLHEASHALIDRLDASIEAEGKALRRDAGDLGHLALFYLTGEATRQLLASRGISYTPYLYANGVIDRGWPSQRGVVDTALNRYLADESLPMATAMRDWIASTPLFRFRSGFWGNLHHFLYVLGRDRNMTADRTREAVVNAPKDVEGLSARPDAERAAWHEAIGSYASGLSKKDAVFDGDLVAVTRALAAAPDDSDPGSLNLDPALVSALRQAAPIYRAVWWPRHARANAARRADLEQQLAVHGARGVARLTALYGTAWPIRPRTVDISAYTNWAGAYSTDGGLIAVSSTDAALAGPDGLEILLHESSHQWDEDMGRRLSAIAARQNRPVPRQLSHALIFYTSGEIVAELVPRHVPYATKYGVWDRGMRDLKVLLDQHWRPYIRGELSFGAAIAAIIAASGAGPGSPIRSA